MSKKIYRECKKTYHLPVKEEELKNALEELKKDHPEVWEKDETGKEYCDIMKIRSGNGYYVMKKPSKIQANRKQLEYQNLIYQLTINYKEDKFLFDRMKNDYKEMASDPECSTKNPIFYNKLKNIPNFLEELLKSADKLKETVERKIEEKELFDSFAKEFIKKQKTISEKKDK